MGILHNYRQQYYSQSEDLGYCTICHAQPVIRQRVGARVYCRIGILVGREIGAILLAVQGEIPGQTERLETLPCPTHNIRAL